MRSKKVAMGAEKGKEEDGRGRQKPRVLSASRQKDDQSYRNTAQEGKSSLAIILGNRTTGAESKTGRA